MSALDKTGIQVDFNHFIYIHSFMNLWNVDSMTILPAKYTVTGVCYQDVQQYPPVICGLYENDGPNRMIVPYEMPYE